MKNWICAFGLALSVGCATAIVRPYVGDQQAWPTASGSIVNVRHGLPVFTTLPPSPYELVAELRINSPFHATPEEGHLPILVKKAKQLEADALIFVQGKIYFSANYGPRGQDPAATVGGRRPTLTQVNTFNPDSFKPEVTVLAVRWLGEPPPGLPAKYAKRSPVAVPYEEPVTTFEEFPTPAPEPPPVETIPTELEPPQELPPVEEPQPPAEVPPLSEHIPPQPAE